MVALFFTTKWAALTITKAAHALFIILQFIKLIVLIVPGLVPKTRASIAATALTLYLSIILIGLSHFEHLRSFRPSALLSLYFGISLVFDIVRTRTLWSIHGNVLFATLFSVSLGFKLALFILESLEKEAGYSQAYDRLAAETAGNVFTRSLFWWLNPLLWKGFRHVLEVDQLPAIDNELTSPELQRQIWAEWNSHPTKTPGLLTKLLFSHYKWAILKGAAPRLALSGFTFAQPFLITRIVTFATEPDMRSDNQFGNGLLAATALIYVGLAIANANAQHKTYRVITMLRGSLVALIYLKTLNTSIPIAQDSSAVTLMSTDVERSGTGLRYMHEIWASPIDIGLSIYLLERQIGPASAAPGVLFLLCSIAGLRVAGSMGQRQKLWLEAIEKRVKATSDMLSAMKEVRMGGLQDRLEMEIQALRTKEIEVSRKFKNALALIVCLSYTTTAMAPVFSFGIFSILAKKNGTTPLTTDKAFTSLAVFALLRQPMALLIDSIAGVVAAMGAIGRIGEYLALDSHLPPQQHIRPSSSPSFDSDPKGKEPAYDPVPMHDYSTPQTFNEGFRDDSRLVNATNFSCGWNREKPFVLNNLNFSIVQSSLTFIIGPVGCGKSSLLHAILGETTKNDGSLVTSFSRAAFCSQAPWLINESVRKNILGMSMLDQGWYDQVIDACALRDDINRLPKGDLESVGSSGVNLSGGQQARVAVARAVYSRQKVILLDDVMSGLDARTETTIFNNLLGPQGLLKQSGTTVIFATNALHRLSAGSHIIALGGNGQILEQGPFSELTSVAKHGQSSHPEAGEFEDIPIKAADAEIRGVMRSLTSKEIVGPTRRTGDLTIYKYYAQTVGYLNFTLFIVAGSVFVFALVFPQYLVKWWSDRNENHIGTGQDLYGDMWAYIGGYFGLGCLAIIGLGSGTYHLVVNMMPRASRAFHTSLLRTALNAPLSLFSETDVGDTVNRFSQDLQLADMELPLSLFNTSIELLSAIAQFIMIAISAKFIGATMPAVLLAFFLIQKFYLRAARQLRLLDIEAKGPLVSGFLESLAGLASIRSFGWEAEYEQRNQDLLDYSQKPNYLLYAVQRWLNLVLDFTVAGVAIIVITIAVKTKGHIDPGLVGIALVNIVNFSVTIKALLANWTELETSIGAVSRVRSFAVETRSEHLPHENHPTPPNWPSEGIVDYHEVTATWEGKTKPVINKISLGVETGKKLAICGRSGSGKSSLVSALFRLLEPSEGAITIDGVDVSTLRRQDVRSRLICVTQAPFLLSSSVRDNIDPFSHASDEDVVAALQRVQMWEVVQEVGGLDTLIDGDKMSIGQKQLLCLARATLRPGSVLVLDEATASLDFDTDELVQQVIRTCFKNHTIITVAHRLQTIVDYDHVAVISDGKLAEYGPPAKLLQNQDSMFAKLYRVSAGAARVAKQKSMAVRNHSRKASKTQALSVRRGQSLHQPPPKELDTGIYISPAPRSTILIDPELLDADANLPEVDTEADIAPYYDDGEDIAPLVSSIRTVAPTSDSPDFSSTALSSVNRMHSTVARSRTVRERMNDALMSYSGLQPTMSVSSTMAPGSRMNGLSRLQTTQSRRRNRTPDRLGTGGSDTNPLKDTAGFSSPVSGMTESSKTLQSPRTALFKGKSPSRYPSLNRRMGWGGDTEDMSPLSVDFN